LFHVKTAIIPSILQDKNLEKILQEYSRDINFENIRGFNSNYQTHIGVAEAIAKGEADVGLALKHAATIYGLYFIPVTWEKFDFLISKSFYKSHNNLIEVLLETIDKHICELDGYKKQ